MSEPTALTAVVLCHNSEQTLSTCLESLRFASHLIVADDGSVDDSLEIAKRYKATIISLSKTSDFSKKRNQALEVVTTPWALFVDSDEEVTSTLRESIESFVASAPPTTNGAKLKREDEFMGRQLHFGETGSTWLLRLARPKSGTWKRSVHEVWDVEGQISTLPGIIFHRPHPSIQSFFEKIIGYTQIEARSRVKKPSVWLWIKTWIELFFFPPLKFLYTFILKAGFRDGFSGLVMSYMMSMHSLWVRIQVLELLRQR